MDDQNSRTVDSLSRDFNRSASIDGTITSSYIVSDNPQPASHRRTVQGVQDPSSNPQQIQPPLCISAQPPRMETIPSASPVAMHQYTK